MRENAELTHSGKKKVLLVIRWPVGGIRTFVRYVYRNFDPSKWHFTIIAPEHEQMKILVDDLSKFEVVHIPVFGIPNDGSSGFWKMFRCVTYQILRNEYVLVHSHGFTSGMCAAIPSFLRHTPHLMTSHETLNDKQFAGMRGKTRKLGMEVLFRLIDKVHSVSYDAQDNFLGYFSRLARKRDKFLVIPNGIEVDRFLKAESRNLRNELELDNDVFLIGFLGRFMAPKGFFYLVEAIDILLQRNDLPRRPLVLMFGEGGWFRAEMRSIQKKGLEDYFLSMPFTPNVASTIKALDVVTMPSLWEACGLLAMETLICGTPLIGSNCIGLREVLRGTPAKTVPKADADALAQALLQEMKMNRKEIFMSFRKTAAEKFDVTNTSQHILNLYQTLVR